jgi:GNAT superfamily N-acetyltransferase
MSTIIIRQCEKKDIPEIIEICYKTGYVGEDLTNSNKFNDSYLFGLIFCLYYPLYEIENCFVAVDGNKVIGYIVGTHNSKRQRKWFIIKMLWRIIIRLFACTIWRDPESFLTVMNFSKDITLKLGPNNLFEQYPAHFHTDILSQYQRQGIGTMLIAKFEEHIKSKNICGIHLITSNNNHKAIKFYQSKGYYLIAQEKSYFWRDILNYKSFLFAKNFDLEIKK